MYGSNHMDDVYKCVKDNNPLMEGRTKVEMDNHMRTLFKFHTPDAEWRKVNVLLDSSQEKASILR